MSLSLSLSIAREVTIIYPVDMFWWCHNGIHIGSVPVRFSFRRLLAAKSLNQGSMRASFASCGKKRNNRKRRTLAPHRTITILVTVIPAVGLTMFSPSDFWAISRVDFLISTGNQWLIFRDNLRLLLTNPCGFQPNFDVVLNFALPVPHYVMESNGGPGGVLSLSFQLLIRLGNDTPLLRPY